MKKNKKVSVLFLIAVMLLAGTLIYVGMTYARYTGTATGTGEAQVAKWAAKVGDANLAAGDAVMTGKLIFVPDTNANVIANKIAPASTAKTTFDIDPTGAEVAIEYEFTLTPDPSAPTNFKVVGVKAGTTTITPTAGVYTGTIALPAGGTTAMGASEKVTVEVTIEWEHLTDESLDANDTVIGSTITTLELPVSVTVRQKI